VTQRPSLPSGSVDNELSCWQVSAQLDPATSGLLATDTNRQRDR